MQGQNFIDGQWVSGASANRNINPSNVTDVIGEYAQADRQQAAAAIASARNAFAKWSVGSIQSPTAQTWDGRALAIIRGKGQAGRVTIDARSEGLREGSVTLHLT